MILPEEIKHLRNSKSEDDRKECLKLLEDFLKSHPDSAEAWYDKAGCHDFRGEEIEAEPCYRKCFELGWQNLPDDQQKSFFVGFGSTLRNNLKFDESIEILKAGLEANPDDPSLKTFLAFSYYSKGQFQLAAETLFSTVLHTAKGFDGYDRVIGWYVDHLKDHPAAVNLVPQPRIETKRLVLEAFKPSDLADLFEYCQNPEMTKYLTWDHHKSIEESKKVLDFFLTCKNSTPGKLFYVFAIRLKDNNKVIGTIDFKNPKSWIGQIDYTLSADYWRRGIMSEAAGAVRDWAFENSRGMVRFQAGCQPENVGSAKVMEKIGMKFEGIQHKIFMLKGKPIDLAYYVMLR